MVYITRLKEDGPSALVRMDVRRAEELLAKGEPLPFAADCLSALRAGAEECAVLDGGAEHALLLYLLEQSTPGVVIGRTSQTST